MTDTPERIATDLARELARSIPSDGGYGCVFCGHSIADEDAGGNWFYDADIDAHEDDCPWRTARLWADAHPEPSEP